jgi:hypothetical protein
LGIGLLRELPFQGQGLLQGLSGLGGVSGFRRTTIINKSLHAFISEKIYLIILASIMITFIVNGDYAAFIAISVPTRFWSLFGRVKSPKRSSSRSQFFSQVEK